MSAQVLMAVWGGTAGGFLMLACLIVGASRMEMGWDSPMRWIASLLASEPGLIMAGEATGGASAVTVLVMGLAIHFLAAIALARAFLGIIGGVARRLAGIELLCVGVIYGAAVWVIARFVGLRVFDNVMYARVQLLPWTFLVAHLLYGATLSGLALMARRWDAP
jgi:hypothetical protein